MNSDTCSSTIHLQPGRRADEAEQNSAEGAKKAQVPQRGLAMVMENWEKVKYLKPETARK